MFQVVESVRKKTVATCHRSDIDLCASGIRLESEV